MYANAVVTAVCLSVFQLKTTEMLKMYIQVSIIDGKK